MAAFMAAGKGMKVERLENDITIDGKTLGKGSFLISEGDQSALDAVAREACTEPVYAGRAGSLPAREIKIPRIALVETYFSDMDAGWTRYLFDTYHIPYNILHPDEFEGAGIEDKYDIIIFPGTQKNLLMNGKPGSDAGAYMSNYHPDFQKGMGKGTGETAALY